MGITRSLFLSEMKIAFVTGANKGIGLATVKKLGEYLNRNEWDVYLTSRTIELGQKAVADFNRLGLKIKYHQLDITDKASRDCFLKFVREKYPDGINIAVCNAGITYKVNATNPFGEQASVTNATNFTATLDFI